MTDEVTNAQAIIDLARSGLPVNPVDGMAGLLAVPDSTGVRIADYRRALNVPPRPSGNITVYTPDAFIAHMNNLNATKSGAAIFADANPQNPAITAILNYDQPNGQAGWRDHRLMISFRTTPQWDLFLANSGKMMAAAEFAEFIEDNRRFFVTPSSADMMHIVQNFEVSSQVKTRQVIRLDNGGVQISHQDDPDATILKNPNVEKSYTIPQEFELALRPYQGSKQYRVKAAFRWRLRDGVLSFGYKLLDTDKYVEDAVGDFVGQIANGIEYKKTTTDAESGITAEEIVGQLKLSDDIPVYQGIAPEPTK
jgi:uncharacterized protein YfdQ (DUF2303 family)